MSRLRIRRTPPPDLGRIFWIRRPDHIPWDVFMRACRTEFPDWVINSFAGMDWWTFYRRDRF